MSPCIQSVCLLDNHYHSLQFGRLSIIKDQKRLLVTGKKNLGGQRTNELLIMSSLSK